LIESQKSARLIKEDQKDTMLTSREKALSFEERSRSETNGSQENAAPMNPNQKEPNQTLFLERSAKKSMHLTPQQMKTALFVLFLSILAATAIITLLGVLEVIKIKESFLTALFTSLLIELVAAVIALFKKTSFFGDEKMLEDIDAVEKRVRSL